MTTALSLLVGCVLGMVIFVVMHAIGYGPRAWWKKYGPGGWLWKERNVRL